MCFFPFPALVFPKNREIPGNSREVIFGNSQTGTTLKISEKSNESDIRRRYSVRSSSINTSNGDLTKVGLIGDKKKTGKNANGGQLIEAEASATGSVKGYVYKAYFVYIGLAFVICVILSNVT